MLSQGTFLEVMCGRRGQSSFPIGITNLENVDLEMRINLGDEN